MPFLTLIFLIIPVIEIYLLIQVGEVIGALWTVFLVVLTAVIGVRLLKIQGISTLARAQQKMGGGQMPAEEMLEGMGLVVAGAFLLTPGFFTDSIGFLLLFPVTRRLLVAKIVRQLMASGRFVSVGGMHSQNPHSQSQSQSQFSRSSTSQQGDIIDGVKYKRED